MVVCHEGGKKDKPISFPLPTGLERNEFNNDNNPMGKTFLAEEVRRCLKAGKAESPLLPLADSVLAAEICAEVAGQAGVALAGADEEASDAEKKKGAAEKKE